MACKNCGKLHGVAGSCNCSSIESFPYYSGPRGYQGAQGNIGAQGYQGSQGPQGPQGTIGSQGNQGSLSTYLTVDSDTLWIPSNYDGTGTIWDQAFNVIRFFVNGVEQNISGVSFNSSDAKVTWIDGPEMNHDETAEGPGLYGKKTIFYSAADPFDIGHTTSKYQVKYTYQGVAYYKSFNVNYNVSGPQGPVGYQGTQGTTGAIGVQGYQGEASIGPQGSQGPTNSSEFMTTQVTITAYQLKNDISGGVDILDYVQAGSYYVQLMSIVGKNPASTMTPWDGNALTIKYFGSIDICEFELGFMESPISRVDMIYPSGNLISVPNGGHLVAISTGNYAGDGSDITLDFIWRIVEIV